MNRLPSWTLLLALSSTAAFAADAAAPSKKPATKAPAKGAAGKKVPKGSQGCVDCHEGENPGIVEAWRDSKHALKDVGCLDCHKANPGEPDAFDHKGDLIATIVTPMDCARCHEKEQDQFAKSHHAKAGDILASLDNFLAEKVEGAPLPFNPHGPTMGRLDGGMVNGLASVQTGCMQCHGGKVGLLGVDGGTVTLDDLKPDAKGMPTQNQASIFRDEKGRPTLTTGGWPNTGIGRLNLDGTRGACSACHSRHDFSARRARQPENCGKCHLGPDHPQKEVYEESKHGIAYRDLSDKLKLDADKWVLGETYSAAPTCATCHMSANVNDEKITHDPGERIAWTNRPPVSLTMDTDANHKVVKETDPAKRAAAITDTWQAKRERMTQVCVNCHAKKYVGAFFTQYDEFVALYNEKYGKPGQAIMDALNKEGLLTKAQFDEEVEWTWYYLWHHEGRRARHGASMMAPDYAHWHGMFEVAEHFYEKFIPQVREVTHKAAAAGKVEQAKRVDALVDGILNKPEHQWKAKAQAPAPAPAPAPATK